MSLQPIDLTGGGFASHWLFSIRVETLLDRALDA